MSESKYINKICVCAFILSLVFVSLCIWTAANDFFNAYKNPAYENKLFDQSTVHTIDIKIDDYSEFVRTANDKQYHRCSINIDNDKFENVAIRTKGQLGLSEALKEGKNYIKYQIDFSEYKSSNNYYGLDKLSLINFQTDISCMRQFISYNVLRNFDIPSPLCSYTVLTINNKMCGLYLAVEVIDKSFLKRNYGYNYGALYKPSGIEFYQNKITGNPNTSMIYNNSKDHVIEKGTIDTSLQYTNNDYNNYKNIFDNAKTPVNNDDKNRLLSSLKQLNNKENLDKVVEVDEVIRYFVVNSYLCNTDFYDGQFIHNYYLYEKNGQLAMIPWDYDFIFMILFIDPAYTKYLTDISTQIINYPIDGQLINNSIFNKPMLNWIFENNVYTDKYHKAYTDFLSTNVDNNYLSNLIDNTSTLILPYIKNNMAKNYSYNQFKLAVSTLKKICELRTESVKKQLNGQCPSYAKDQDKDTSNFVDAHDVDIWNTLTIK